MVSDEEAERRWAKTFATEEPDPTSLPRYLTESFGEKEETNERTQ